MKKDASGAESGPELSTDQVISKTSPTSGVRAGPRDVRERSADDAACAAAGAATITRSAATRAVRVRLIRLMSVTSFARARVASCSTSKRGRGHKKFPAS